MLITSAAICLALNIYHESRGEPVAGQIAVAQVTLKRAKDKEEICRTVGDRKQFSWTNNGNAYVGRYGLVIAERMRPKNQMAWNLSLVIADAVLKGKLVDYSRGATHYHATRVSPYWTTQMRVKTRIGSHIFYS